MNANERFVQYNDAGDNFFKEELKKRNIRVSIHSFIMRLNMVSNLSKSTKTNN